MTRPRRWIEGSGGDDGVNQPDGPNGSQAARRVVESRLSSDDVMTLYLSRNEIFIKNIPNAERKPAIRR